jgi:hypothetical protein
VAHATKIGRRATVISDAARKLPVTPVLIQETINGRRYIIIEVLLVGRDRWRAHLASAPGARTALMPFYGPTPDEAVKLLSGWLTKVGRPSV